MRLSCEFKTKEIPESYSMMFTSLIKKSLSETDEEYFKNLYFYDVNKNNKRTKNFCFSVFLKDFEKKEDVFKINDRIILNISSPDYEFILKVYNGILNIKEFKYKNFSLRRIRINLVKEKKIETSKTIFKTLSPIFIKNKNNEFVDIKNINEYEKELNYIVNESLIAFQGIGLKEELKFIPLTMKRRVVKEIIRGFTEKTNKKYCYVNSYFGEFQLCGNIKDLQDIYNLGIGFKRGQGFGMIDIVK